METLIKTVEAPRRIDGLLHSLARKDRVDEVQERFGKFVAEQINPGAVERDRTGTPISRELFRAAGELGLMGFTAPVEVGGEGRSWRDWGLVLHELCYLSTDTALPMVLAYCGTITKLLWETKRPDLIDRYVKPMVRGECLGGFAWSEGNDAFSFRTTVRRTADGYILNGFKNPIADGLIAHVSMTFAKSEETGDIVSVLVEQTDPGVEVIPFNAMGLRSAGLAGWRFTDVKIPSDRVLVEVDGLSYAQRFLNERRLEMCCWTLGRMRSLFDACVLDVINRRRYNLPLSEMQNVQATLGKMYVGMETSRVMVSNILSRIARSEYDWLWDPPLAVLKCHVIEQALEMCRHIQDITGGYGVFEKGPYERHIRDLQCLNPIAGTLMTLIVDLGVLTTDEVRRTKGKGAASNATHA
jgi:alkylation response protein AidB-like acyl-CoA dehydrogenase